MMKEKIMKNRSDMQIDIAKAKEVFGINNPALSLKTNIFSISKLQEMILQYLMTQHIWNATPKEEGGLNYMIN